MSKYFYHGTQGHYFGLQRAHSILATGGIKCKKLLNLETFSGYNGSHYISICKKEDDQRYFQNSNNGFYRFVQNSFCFVISDSIEAIKTKMPNGKLTHETLERGSIRFSDLFDEWQVKEQIPLSSIIGIGIPISELKTLFSMQSALEVLKELKEVIAISEELGLDIIDSSEFRFVENYEIRKETGKRIAIKINL